jgi:hypothetical protein
MLEEIINDGSVLNMVISDETTEPELVSTLSVIKQEQEQNPLITETCANQADDDNDGTVDEEECTTTTTTTTTPPTTEICANQADDDNDGTVDEEECTTTTTTTTTPPTTEICAKQADDDNDGTVDEEDCVVATEICANQADDDNDGTVDEEDCVVATEICDNGLDDDADSKIDTADEDCPLLQPTVLIESATDQQGKTLSPGDLIAPGEVTFTFSAQANEAAADPQNSEDYQFECALDDESFSSCNSPMTYTMEEGKHDFVVRLVS